MTKSNSGGKAEATGANYETLVGAWYCTRVLLGRAAQPLFDLPASSRLAAITCQSSEPVDDVNCETSDDGMIFVQAKRSISLSDSATSSLGKAIAQFVAQQKAWADAAKADPNARALDERRDRLILATRSLRSRKVVEILPRLLRGLRDRSDLNSLLDVQTSQQEREVAVVIEAQFHRHWRQLHGREPVREEIGRLLRLVWVQVVDVEEGERDRINVLDSMRAAFLEDPTQADLAFAELVKQCARLRAERSSTDASTLQTALARVGVRLLALPDYRSDIEALRSWTRTQLKKSVRFTRLLESETRSTIAREVWPEFRQAAETHSFLAIGDPGAGKSGLIYRLAQDLFSTHRDVVFIPVDLIGAGLLTELQAELGISRPLAEVLENWPGSNKAVLIVDALDAARKFETQTVFRETIDQVLRLGAGRWNVIASVRKYDLRQGMEWRRMFEGVPLSKTYAEKEFGYVQHIAVSPLSEKEIRQTLVFSADLNKLYLDAHPDLKALLRNIFNFHLLAKLVAQGVVNADLISIRTQTELLETYWRYRIRRDDGKHDARDSALTEVTKEMIARKALRVFRADIRDRVDTSALVDLEQHDILRSHDDGRAANDEILQFSHNVLFDYAVAKLLFRRGRDPQGLIGLLRGDRTLALIVGPSLTMALRDLWTSDTERRGFWQLALAIATEDGLAQAAYVAAPMAAAEFTAAFTDLDPLLSALRAGQSPPKAESLLQNLIGALLVLQKAGAPLVGAEAPPWMSFVQALAMIGTDSAMFALRPVLALGTDKPERLTKEQMAAAGAAARRLLDYGLSRTLRNGNLIIVAIEAAARTIGSDPVATSAILRRLIEPAHLAQFGYEELRWLASHVKSLAVYDTQLVIDIYEAAYSYSDTQADEKTNISGSAILSLTSNRRQDYQSSWYQLETAAPALLKNFPREGARAIARALAGYVRRERQSFADENQSPKRFDLSGSQASFIEDGSHYWYRGGYAEPTDGPALVKKFDEFLTGVASEQDAAATLSSILGVLGEEAGLAVLWGSLLVAGAAHPEQFANVLAPLATASPILESDDTRYQAGKFIEAAYEHLTSDDRGRIEAAVLRLATQGLKEMLAGCIPPTLVTTAEMRAFLDGLPIEKERRTNTQPYQITSYTRAFDTDHYLQQMGVSTEGPANLKLRELMRPVEALPQAVHGPQIDLETALARLQAMRPLHLHLEEEQDAAVDPKLYEHAAGVLADAASRTASAPVEVIRHGDVRPGLRAMLLLCAQSANPHFNAEFEEKFHDHLSWGGPSARTAAAQGLIWLIRSADDADPLIIEAIHRLVRDPVCCVRLQIADHLHYFAQIELDWMWAEYEYIAQNEATHGVVNAALSSAARVAFLDVPRFIALAKSILARYSNQSGAGIGATLANAISAIIDIYVWTDNQEAQEYYQQQLARFPENSEYLRSWVFRYASNLTAGIVDGRDKNTDARLKTIGLYHALLSASIYEANQLLEEHGVDQFRSWEQSQKDILKSMFDVMDEVTMRLFFAAGGNNDESLSVVDEVRVRLYQESRPLLEMLSEVMVVHVAHYLIQTLERFIPINPAGIFELIARSVRAAAKTGYPNESMGADLIVKVVERYLADHREIFSDPNRLSDLMDCLDAFAGWPTARAMVFKLSEIWR